MITGIADGSNHCYINIGGVCFNTDAEEKIVLE